MKLFGGLARFGLATLAVVVAIILARSYLAPTQKIPANWSAGDDASENSNISTLEVSASKPTILEPESEDANFWDQDRDSDYVPQSENEEVVAPIEFESGADELSPPRETAPQ